MVGQLGDTAVAAVGLANQIWFLLSLFLFGVGSGATIFAAQFWGRRDRPNVRRSLGLALILAAAGSTLFTLAAFLAPAGLLALYTQDPAVIDLGSRYLRIACLCYIPTAISTIYGMILRSTHHVRMPTAVSVGALSFKTALAFGLIFGVGGLPALGALGAALATCIARGLECAVLLVMTYRRDLPAAARPAEMFDLERPFLARFLRTAWPVIIGEMLWSLGITTYSAIYGHMSTQAITSTNIATTIESVALVPFFSLAAAAAVILGNAIGADQVDRAQSYARRFLGLNIAGAVCVGALIFAGAGAVMSLYRITPVAEADARGVLTVLAFALWIKASNALMVVGILRSGGDTRFALFADVAPLWLIGLPMALLGAFVLRLPVYWVVLMVMADELTKFVLCSWRVLSGVWIHNVIQALPVAE